MCFQWTSKQRIRLNLPISALYLHFSVLSPFQRFTPISAFYPHFSVLSPFQRFIPISAFYLHFSVLSPFQRFIPISAFYPHFSVLSPFQFPLSVSVSAIQFQRFIPTRNLRLIDKRCCVYLHVNAFFSITAFLNLALINMTAFLFSRHTPRKESLLTIY